MTNRDGFLYRNYIFGEELPHSKEHTIVPVKGTNKKYPNVTALQYGYAIKYSFDTVGDFADENDSIRITPKFTWISKDRTQRIEDVNVYYNDTINGKYRSLVKCGDELDLSNQKLYSLADYGIDQNIIDNTAKLLKYTDASKWTNITKNHFCPSAITITSNLRTFDGKRHYSNLVTGETERFKDLKEAVAVDYFSATGVSMNDIDKSVQTWYGMYYLPSETFVTICDAEEVKRATANGFTGKEDIWYKDGYLLISFDVVAYDGDRPYIAYDNTAIEMEPAFDNEGGLIGYNEGTCNMWDWESFDYEKGIDPTTPGAIPFKPGDIVIYDIAERKNASAEGAYTSGGTH